MLSNFPSISAAISKHNAYLSNEDGWKIVSMAVPISKIDEKGRDACFEEIKNQSVENWPDQMRTCLVDTTLEDIIVKCVYNGYRRKGMFRTTGQIRTIMRDPNFEYPYTLLKIAESNPLKISAISKKVVVAPALAAIEKLIDRSENNFDKFITYAKVKGLHCALNSFYTMPCNTVVTEEFRVAKGTYIKPAKYITSVFGPEFTKDEISVIAGDIADRLRELCHKDDTDVVQVSNRPSEIYTLPTDEGMDSCMIDMDSRFFELYDDMPDTSIAYIMQDDELVARALLHNRVMDENTGEAYKIMDRIYYADSDSLAIMKLWAKKNGYLRKETQSANIYEFITPEGSVKTLNNISIECDLHKHQYRFAPYMDTFFLLDTLHPTKLRSQQDYETEELTKYVHVRHTEGYVKWLCRTDTKCCKCGEYIYLPDEEYRKVNDNYYCEACVREMRKNQAD